MTATLALPQLRLERARWWPLAVQLGKFGVVGAAATMLQLGLFAFLSADIGSQLANVVSWLVATVVATEGHRRFSFAVSRPTGEADHLVGVVTSAAALGAGALALALLGNPAGAAGVVALVAVNAAVGLLRFLVLRRWMLRVGR